MLNSINVKVCVCFLFLAMSLKAHASTGFGEAIVVETQPKAFVPSITLHGVSGSFSNITNVRISLLGSDLTDLMLYDKGNNTWEAKLTPEQVKALLADKSNATYSAKLVVQSKNDKGRIENKTENIQITLHN